MNLYKYAYRFKCETEEVYIYAQNVGDAIRIISDYVGKKVEIHKIEFITDKILGGV